MNNNYHEVRDEQSIAKRRALYDNSTREELIDMLIEASALLNKMIIHPIHKSERNDKRAI